jgi:hypothetical protein
MSKITIPAELARAIVYDDSDEGELVEVEIFDTSRWSLTYKAIIKYQDKFYKTFYRVGATEQQEEKPWEFDDVAELVEVHQVPKTVTVWEKV